MSEFIFLFRASDEDARAAIGTPEQAQKSLQAWLSWTRELETNGYLKNRGQPLARTGKIIRGDRKIVTDGPFVESKDMVLGFLSGEARDITQAIELANGCPILSGGGGSVEVRPVQQLPWPTDT